MRASMFLCLVVLCCVLGPGAPLAAAATPITLSTVAVGNAGNANDSTGFGGVHYAYRIGTTEVTNAQYVAFLTEKAKSDPLALYNAEMGSDVSGGITQRGESGSFAYAVKANMGAKPVNFVSWYDAIRFVNWLHNGQGSGDTETGAYTILGGTATPSNGKGITRNPGASWFLPSENEWYKAAYHQPAAQGGDSDDYWNYPTHSNISPTFAVANDVGDINNPGANVANIVHFYQNGQVGKLTSVASAGPLSNSYYGTSDQAGNVWEWNEALISDLYRGMRGGSFRLRVGDDLAASHQDGLNAIAESFNVGFRVAGVPSKTQQP